ncbi:MAG: L,D-transpeptidase family protein [Pseudomonadota bacterium]
MFEHISVRRKPGTLGEGLLHLDENRVFRCALGRTGTTVFKREGDGATPAHAVMRPLWGYWRADRLGMPPASPLDLRAIGPRDGWCDASAHPAYNTPVTLPISASHETMMRDDVLYDLCIVLDWNMPPMRSRNRGSAIFLHAAKPGYPPTQGCIALSLPDLRKVVAVLTPDTRISVLRQA